MVEIASEVLGRADAPVVVFAHGWGRSRADFVPVAELIAPHARCILLDLPGFGASPRPETAWGTEDYACHLRAHLADHLGATRYIWVGHSFGGRVGLRLGADADSPLQHLVMVAGAGVKKPVSALTQLKSKWRSREFKRKRASASEEEQIIALERQYGSADYVQSRETGLRDIFVKTVQEDQTATAPKVGCPTTLIYGGKDTETPPALGHILNGLIPNSCLIECPEFDHLSILTRGRHQIALVLKELLTEAPTC